MTDPSERAAQLADWQQVVLNGGPPCFHFEANRGLFCLRSERWAGHGEADDMTHKFVTLADLLASERELGVAAGLTSAAKHFDKRAEEHEAAHLGHYGAVLAELRRAADDCRSLIPAEVLREQADSATLARGLAIEQAAQRCKEVARSYQGWPRSSDYAAAIRSLDPDAAQALAHHNARVFHDTLDDLKHDGSELVVGGKEPVRVFSEAELERRDAELKRKWLVETANRQAAHEAEIERRARLMALKAADSQGQAWVREQIAALESGK